MEKLFFSLRLQSLEKWVITSHIRWGFYITIVRRPRGDIGRKHNNVNIPYVRNHDPVRTPSLSRTYAIMIPYVRNHDSVRTQYIPYVRNHDPVRTQSWSRTYAIKISYVRNHDHVRTQSWSRTYAIMIPYVRNHYHVRTQSWSRTYAIIIAYVRNYYPVRILNCFILLTYYASRAFICLYISWSWV